MKLFEMEGFLRGKCLPGDMKVNETNAEYLVRKFAEADSKCAVLAAENGQMLRLLTDISENHDEYVNQDEYLYAGVPMDYVSEINAYVSRDVEAENPFKETDAFLADVRAQGVTMFSDWLIERIHGWQLEGVTPEDLLNFHQAVTYAAEFAENLREGESK